MYITKGDSVSILQALRVHRGERVRSTKSPLYKYVGKDFSGDSYLINPESLLNDTRVPSYYICQYIYLASLRNLGYYLLTKDPSLDVKLITIDLQKLLKNPLLKVANNRIYFKYEG